MLLPGDWVEVRSAREILSTLDENQALEGMPFMPEMLALCGRRFRVLVRAERTCARGLPPGTAPLRRLERAVVLEGLRCDGASHGGCQLGCMIFWKEAWLRSAPGGEPAREHLAEPPVKLRATRKADPAVYFCQGTELARATLSTGPRWNPMQYLRILRVRTLSPLELLGMLARAGWRKAERTRRSRRPAQTGRGPAPEGVLALEPGDWVQVRSKEEIHETLDGKGSTRGLAFSSDMYDFCGKTLQVRRRIDTILREDTGAIRSARDTVSLEGADCRRHMGCARQMPLLWREAWLKRVEPPRR